jgi:hypothetical protein
MKGWVNSLQLMYIRLDKIRNILFFFAFFFFLFYFILSGSSYKHGPPAHIPPNVPRPYLSICVSRVNPRGVRSSDAGCQICHESLTAAISKPWYFNGINTQIKQNITLLDIQIQSKSKHDNANIKC